MKILLINAVCDIGSTGRMVKEEAHEIEQYGHECHIAYSSGKSTDYSKVYKIGNVFGKKIHAMLSRITGCQGCYSSFATRQLIRYIRKEKFDIIHLGNLHSNYINIKILLDYLAKSNSDVVITLHDCWFYTGRCYHYTVEKCMKWQNGCHDCPRLHKDSPSWIFDASDKLYNEKKRLLGAIKNLAVVGVSNWITNEVSMSFLKEAALIRCIYNWIDTDIFKPVSKSKVEQLKIKYDVEDKFIILSAAVGWAESKGLDKLLKIAKMLKKDEIMILVGAMLSKDDLPDNVISIGFIENPEDLAVLYSAADCYVSMSLEESFGLVVAEAQACGTPAVVYNSTALPELVSDGCGYAVPVDSSTEEIYETISEIRNKGKKSFSEECILNAQNNFSMRKNIAEYIAVYNTLIEMKKL